LYAVRVYRKIGKACKWTRALPNVWMQDTISCAIFLNVTLLIAANTYIKDLPTGDSVTTNGAKFKINPFGGKTW